MSTITLDSKELRDPLVKYMQSKEIDCRQMVYPVHMAAPYKNNNNPDDYPVSSSISLRSLHLPSSLYLQEEQQTIIAELIYDWLQVNG